MSIKSPTPHHQKHSHNPYSRQQGVSLIEVLITVVVTSFGLLGIAGLQLASVNASTAASVNTQTMISIDEIVGQIRSNSVAAKAGEFDIDLDGSGNLVAFSTSLAPAGGASISKTGAYNWFRNLNQSIPGVKAGINCNSTSGICAIKVELPIKIDSNGNTNMTQIVSLQL